MSSNAQESYCTPGFAQFYDEMVARLPPEFEAGADLDCVYWPLLRELANRSGGCGISPAEAGQAPGSNSSCSAQLPLTVLDMCTGSGRVALGLAARWAAWEGAPACAHLTIVGVDSSAEMLAAARSKAAALLPQPTTSGGSGAQGGSSHSSSSGRFDLVWLLQDMAAQHPPLQQGTCALAIVSAGSFHHLLTPDDQAAALRSLAACLQPPPARAFLVMSLLGPEHLAAAAGQVTLAGPYRRTCLEAAREAAPDGGALWRHRFRLQHYGSEAAAATGDAAALLWEREEGWALREVAPAELERLAAAAGLRLVRCQARWSDGWGSDTPECAAADARVFVLALAGA